MVGIEQERERVAPGQEMGGLLRRLGADADDGGPECFDFSSGRRQLRQLLEARCSTEVANEDDDGGPVDVVAE